MKLTSHFLVKPQVCEIPDPMHRIVVIDCSGSMSSDLPKLRTHLKNKIPTLVQKDDCLSIVWFSSKGQYGVLFEAVNVSTLQDLSAINSAIDRFIVPVGMTGFAEPLEEVQRLATSYSAPAALIFMSDGADNCSVRSKVLTTCTALSDILASALFVEFSYYADSKMLQEMAEASSGSVMLAEDFASYSGILEKSLKTATSSKKIKIKHIKTQFVVGVTPDGYVVCKPDAIGTVTLPANCVAYATVEPGEFELNHANTVCAPAMIGALIQRGTPDLALELAVDLGDEAIYKAVENAFSKQDYARVVERVSKVDAGANSLFATPRNTNLKPDDNAYNVLTLLMDLAAEDGNYLNISHPNFHYNSIGAKREPIPDSNGFVPKFKDASSDVRGIISALKFDEDRPNISLLVKREGTATLPKNDLGFGDTFPTFIWRNYAIVRDGIVNVKKLPVILSKASHDLLTSYGVVTTPFKVNETTVIDTTKLPVINRSMVNVPSASDIAKLAFDIYALKSKQKLVKVDIEKPEVSVKFGALYGEAGATFLKTYGITEGGFGPPTAKGESVDPYVAKVLEIKMSGLSSIPKVEDVQKAIDANKSLNVSQQVMARGMKEMDAINISPEEKLKAIKQNIKKLSNNLIMIKFGVILGKTFPAGVTLDNPTVSIDVGLTKPIDVTFNLSDKEI